MRRLALALCCALVAAASGCSDGDDKSSRDTTYKPTKKPKGKEDKGDFDPDADDMLPEAISTVVQMGTASTSMLQRRLRVGYTRAGRLIDMMERRGVISGYEGSKARQVLITEADLPRVLEQLAEPAVASPADE